ncbi:acyclic terpene utilization AtuA family protein [Nonomuraea sp. NPDC048916]|uniref:acyclic terpene utilization AtuA family protein n=1 Tax=Nonomuraea sp. NPDC048916 TaxID=3154232 RepID=UPI0033D933A0
MLRIGRWGVAESRDIVACGWRDGRPGRARTGIKLIFEAGGAVPDLPGLRVGTQVVRGAERIAWELCQGLDLVLTEPGDPAASVVAAAIWHYGWSLDDLDALAGATVGGLALAGQPVPCVLEIRRDGGTALHGDVTTDGVLTRLSACFPAGRHPTPEVTVPLRSVRLSPGTPSGVRIAPCVGEPGLAATRRPPRPRS